MSIDKIVEIIERDFEKKKSVNPLFSLRSYAKFLGVSPAVLSKILTKKRRITPKILTIISPKLNLDPVQFNQFIQITKKKKKEESVRTLSDDDLVKIQMEEFNLMADWYHLAILHMVGLDNFVQDAKWIADRLGITDIGIIEDAIERLIDFGLLKLNNNGEYTKINKFHSVLEYNFSSVAMRNRQKQIMKLNMEKIDLIPIAERDHSTMTLELDVSLVPEIKEKIKAFRRTLGNYVTKNGKRILKSMNFKSVSYLC